MQYTRIKVIFISLLLVFSFSKCITLGNAVSSETEQQISTERAELITFAKELLGTPYRYGGTDKRGFDCSGFTSYVMKEFDIHLSRTSRSQALEGTKVSQKEAQPGDLVFFKRSSMGKVFHVAIIVQNNRNGLEVIHSTSRGVVIDNITDSEYWHPKVWVVKDILTES